MDLNGEYLKPILAPGQNVEWLLDLKPGQVVVAEARAARVVSQKRASDLPYASQDACTPSASD